MSDTPLTGAPGDGPPPDALDEIETIDELELELRRLAGVRAAGFVADPDVVVVRLDVVAPLPGEDAIPPIEAVRIAARHTQRPIAVELVRRVATTAEPGTEPAGPAASMTEAAAGTDIGTEAQTTDDQPRPGDRPARVRLLSVLAFPDTDEVEVHLVLGQHRTIGRNRSSGGPVAVATATVAALVELVPALEISVQWARRIDDDEPAPVVAVSVVVDRAEQGRVRGFGAASGHGPLEATARATLSAVNRYIELLV